MVVTAIRLNGREIRYRFRVLLKNGEEVTTGFYVLPDDTNLEDFQYKIIKELNEAIL